MIRNWNNLCARYVSGSVALAAAMLCGCGSARRPELGEITSVAPSAVAFSGQVFGGQQPITGASVMLYQAGMTGPGQGATNLLTTTVATDQYGSFLIDKDYKCPTSTTQVYLMASGGNPGLPGQVNNTSGLLMAALGDCGNLSTSTFVTINEVTTAGAVWALQQFLGPSGIVGASATNATGLRNAFLTANNLVDTVGGMAPGTALPAGAMVETQKIYTLADALGGCMNSGGGAGCAPLFAAATDNGVVPGNTLDAALAIVQNPTAHLLDVLNAAGTHGPFQPILGNTPTDWTMSVNYIGGGMNLPSALGIDGSGNVWVANYFGGVVSAFSPTGNALSATGFGSGTLNESYGLAIDANNHVWVANEETGYSVNTGYGSIAEFNSSGNLISGAGFAGGGLFFPVSIAADPNGDMWVADNGRTGATLFDPSGNALSGSGYGGSLIPFGLAVAVDGNHNAWFAAQQVATRVAPDGTAASFACCGNSPAGIAIDPAGNVWIADYTVGRVVVMSPTGTVLHRPTSIGGLYAPQGIAIDGAGSVWVTNYHGSSLTELAGSGSAAPATAISPASGYGLAAGMNAPFAAAIDAGGSVWVTNLGGNTLTQFVGAASPVKMPRLGPPQVP